MNDQKIVLIRTVQTAIACPSQWDAWDADGNYYYLRYRHGYGEMRQYQDENWVDAPWKDDIDKSVPGWGIYANTAYVRTVAVFEHGDPLDGVISLEEFAEKAGIGLAPELVKTGLADHFAFELTMEGIPLEQAERITQPWRDLEE